MIKIFDENDTDFSSNGNITFNPLKCREYKKKSLNGWYIEVECEVKYKEYISQDKLCVIRTKSKLRPQAFRIGNIKIQDTVISFTAEHVMFDSRRYFLVDVRPTDQIAHNALSYINERTDKKSPFSIFSDVSTQNTAYFIRKNLLEAWTIIEERWKGSFDADNWDIRFLKKIGNDNGETISYRKNLQDIEIFEDWSNVCTKLYPLGPDELMLEEEFIESDIQYPVPYTKTISFTSNLEFDEEISEEEKKSKLLEELRKNAEIYLEENKYPKFSYEVSSNINQSMEIGDVIHIKHPLVNLLAEVLEYEYNQISQKIEVLKFGNYTPDVKSKFDGIKESFNQFSEQLEQGLTKRDIAIQKQTELINSLNKLGLVYIDENEILILDKIPKEEAKNVWRFGLGGIGFSSNGYEGPFEIAMTMDGQINANFITTGTMATSRIEGLQSTLNDFLVQLNLNSDNITAIVEENIPESRKEAIESAKALIEEKATSITQEVNANIANSEKSLKALLELKLDIDKLISEINASADVIKLGAGRLLIEAGNFLLNSSGHVTVSNGMDINCNITRGIGVEIIGSPPYIDLKTSSSQDFSTRLYDSGSGFTIVSGQGVYLKTGYESGGDASIHANIVYASNHVIATGNVEAAEVIAKSIVKSGNGFVVAGKDDKHKYYINWTGSQLDFFVDVTNVGSLSDKRLKTDIQNIDEDFINIINEIEMKQFKIANRNGLISFGIIAQDLIEIFKRYNKNPFDYEIVREIQYRLDDETIYYAINYEQFLILKTKAQEVEINNLKQKMNDFDIKVNLLFEKLNEKRI